MNKSTVMIEPESDSAISIKTENLSRLLFEIFQGKKSLCVSLNPTFLTAQHTVGMQWCTISIAQGLFQVQVSRSKGAPFQRAKILLLSDIKLNTNYDAFRFSWCKFLVKIKVTFEHVFSH